MLVQKDFHKIKNSFGNLSNPWRPPFGTDRIGSFNEVIIFFPSKEFPAGEFQLAGFRGGKEVMRVPVDFKNAPPVSERMSAEEGSGPVEFFVASSPGTEGQAYTGRPFLGPDVDQLALFYHTSREKPVALGRQ